MRKAALRRIVAHIDTTGLHRLRGEESRAQEALLAKDYRYRGGPAGSEKQSSIDELGCCIDALDAVLDDFYAFLREEE